MSRSRIGTGAAVVLAALGLLNPVIAGGAMALSSVSVVGNALLLRRWRSVEQRQDTPPAAALVHRSAP